MSNHYNSTIHQPDYLNGEESVERRIDDLLTRLTPKEKIGQMTQLNVDMVNINPKSNYAYLDPNRARDVIRNYHIGSFLNGFAITAEEWHEFMEQLQRINLEESRLEIPLIYGIDHIHGASYLKGATIFPHAMNLSNTFDENFARQSGCITSTEAAALGHHWNFAPVLDIGRDPRWPRFYETFGEDPLVASRMGVAYVQGLQKQQTGPYRMAATAKHFIGYSTPLSGRDRSPVHIPMQFLHEFHRPSFQAAIDAGIKSVMVNSGELNGEAVHASYDLLTHLLRHQMGFQGVVVTDWADIIKLTAIDVLGYQQQHYHHVAKDEKEATLMAINAGIDIAMTPMSVDFAIYAHELVEEGLISEKRIDESVRRILRLKFDLGLFEHPLPSLTYVHTIGSIKHRQEALQAARESIVLLENKHDVLPLPQKTGKILLVGSIANSRMALNGGWTMEWQGGNESQYPESMPTLLEAMQTSFPNSEITHLEKTGSRGSKTNKEFRRVAAEADFIFAVVGEMPYCEFVGDINDLTLDVDQIATINAVQATKRPNGIILIEGRPRVVPPNLWDAADAVLFAGLPGFEGGTALAEIISGKVNPSARLGFSYPEHASHFTTYDHKATEKSTSKWAFGHGLSYTTWEYADLKLSKNTLNRVEELTATVTVSNTGKREGRHAVLWFITDEVGRITRPVKKLAHFEKITIPAGASHKITFTIHPSKHLSYPDASGATILETGRFILHCSNLSASFDLVE
ncbi:MAG: glycoside hydrolase family 3 C-terminal domain-containing protein [Balneolales bacterium]|nr:glycoside hydrolase family 3 C-terminal domain-containing protein [Balneolales bacterium]